MYCKRVCDSSVGYVLSVRLFVERAFGNSCVAEWQWSTFFPYLYFVSFHEYFPRPCVVALFKDIFRVLMSSVCAVSDAVIYWYSLYTYLWSHTFLMPILHVCMKSHCIDTFCAQPNPLDRSIANYTLAERHHQYIKYIHKRPKHILLWPFSSLLRVTFLANPITVYIPCKHKNHVLLQLAHQ